MATTRREVVGLMAGTAAAFAAGSSSAAGTTRNLGSSTKAMMWVATVTPCDRNLKFDAGAFRDILAYFKHNGADGIVVLGTTGEFPSFSVAERKLITETALKDKMGMNFIINPGTANFPETLELSKHAADHGADGLLVIPPFYYKHVPDEGLTQYYSMLFDQVQIPINLYHIPGTSGVPITRQLLKNLSHYPHLAGIKDSDGNQLEYSGFVADFPDLNMRTGTSSKLEQALDHGVGAILEDGNLFCRMCANIFTAYRSGQDYHAPLARLRAAEQMLRGVDVIFAYGALKYALSLEMGSPQTYARPPFEPGVNDAQKAAIKKAFRQLSEAYQLEAKV
jgi:4-hydroxy-tetrahydrodipicolinate synthase